MTGVPSVFVGLFVYTALVIEFGFGALMGALSLAIIMMPIIIRSTEEMLKLVPSSSRTPAMRWARRSGRRSSASSCPRRHRASRQG